MPSLLAVSLIAAAASLTGCARDPLSSIDGLRAQISVYPWGLEAQVQGRVLDSSSAGYHCPVIDARATLNGTEIPLSDPGSQPMAMGACGYPVFRLQDYAAAFPAEGPSRLEIGDDTARIVMDVVNRGDPRSVRLVSPSDGVVAPGAQVTVEWSPATDVLVPSAMFVSVHDDSGRELGYVRSADITVNGSLVSFAMPNVPAGQATIEVEEMVDSITACSGAVACYYNPGWPNATTTVQVTP